MNPMVGRWFLFKLRDTVQVKGIPFVMRSLKKFKCWVRSRATVEITVQYLAGKRVEMFRERPSCLCSEDGTFSSGSFVSLTMGSYFLQEYQTGDYF